MTQKISDIELLQELKQRFEENTRTLNEQRSLMEQLKSVNEKLLVSEHLKTNFLSNIRNEINNPIASILELSKNISEGNMSLESVKKFADLIFAETFNLDFQLRNIFFSAEIEAGESLLSVISVNIFSVINNVIDSFKNQIKKKGITLKVNNTINKNQIFHTDSEKLHLIISNLLSNAIQYSHAGGSIEINCKLENRQLIFSITDKGIGISEEDKNKIYDRFRQLEGGSTKTYGGHGLGLSITKALLEIINGAISLESKKGKGSTFTVVINESEEIDVGEDIFSEEGNDFLFNDSDKITF